MWKKIFRVFKYFIITLIALFALVLIYLWLFVKISPPEVHDHRAMQMKRVELGKDYYKAGNNYLRKNEFGILEMYVEGKPFERGAAMGILGKDFLKYQEDVFIADIKKIIPSDFYL